MTVHLRDYQQDLADRVSNAWDDNQQNVLMRLGTGGGKTAILADLITQHNGASCIIAHRQELVSQLSLMLARYGVRHDIIAADATRRAIARAHVDEIGGCYYQPGARCVVASVDTLVRATGIAQWVSQVTKWICDEGHHLVKDNKWAKAIGRFERSDCRGLLPTATPQRADGKGLGRHSDGFADIMIQGPTERWLINEGWLTDYKVYCPTSDIELIGNLPQGGDWSPQQLKEAAQKSHIVGDVPAMYQRFGQGGLGLSFCTDVETAIATAAAYRALGIDAEVLTGKTPDHVRRDILRRYRNGSPRQLCVVDIVSEGFDLPACHVGSFGRPSESLPLVRQQIGRLLRPIWAPGFDMTTRNGRLLAIAASNKPYAILIDQVRHFIKPHIGPPDRHVEWSLDRRDSRRKSDPDVIPLRVCIECFQPYERFYRACPHCGHYPEPAGRSSPEQVDGDLAELSAEALERLRGAVVDTDRSPQDYARDQAARTGLPQFVISTNAGRYERRVEAQLTLRAAMARWGGTQRAAGLTDEQMQRKFWLTYGLDVLSAQGLGATDAAALTERIDGTVNRG